MTVIGMIVLGVVKNDKLPEGDPARLINGIDYTGEICGLSTKRNEMNVSISTLPKAYYLPSGAPVCVKECPTEDNFQEYHCRYNAEKKVSDEYDKAESSLAGSGGAVKTAMYMSYVTSYDCMPHVATRDVMGYCVPEAAISALTEAASAAMNEKLTAECQQDDVTPFPVDGSSKYWKNVQQPMNCTAARKGIKISASFLDPATKDGFFDRANADLKTSQWWIIGFGCGVAMVIGFVYLTLLKVPGVLTVMVWGLINLVLACLLGLGYYMYLMSDKWDEEGGHSDTEILGMKYCGYFFGGLGGVWALFICCIRKRIKLAVGCVKEAAKSIQAMPVITVYPVFQVAGVLVFLVPWIVYMTYLASGGEVVVDCICPSAEGFMDKANSAYAMAESAATGEEADQAEANCDEGCFMYKTFSYTSNSKLAGLYMMFAWFWTSQFIIACGQLVVAMSVSMWYFTRDKKTVGNGTFFLAARRAMWYHMGTAAFGSLIIAIIKTIRVIISYIQNKFKKSKNQIIIALLCALQCYMWCIEKCMKFLNKNAYIQTAIFGYSFCKAARKAFFLILRNVLRISAVSVVSSFVLIIGKIFIMCFATFAGYTAMVDKLDGQVNYIWIPTVLICFISYFTAEMFNEVFGMAISTILQCFVADEEMFEVSQRFAEGDLAKMIGKTNKDAKGRGDIHPEKDYEKGGEEGKEDLA